LIEIAKELKMIDLEVHLMELFSEKYRLEKGY
jgi:hypothetical protein